jgi:GTP-binding protein SAR1
MFLVDWFFGTLSFFGLYYKDAKILFLGLDNSGKTTLLSVLKTNKLASADPTFHPNYEELIVGNLRLQTHDLGGHEAARRLWKDYFTQVDGVVFIVDAADCDRFPEARKELAALLDDDSLHGVPIVVLGNKVDLHWAVSEPVLRSEIGLYHTTGKEAASVEGRPLELFMCSVVRNMGYGEALEWLSFYL